MTETPPSPVAGKTNNEWIVDVAPKIAQAQLMIEETLSKDAKEQSAQATMTEDAYREISEVLAEANAWLDYFEYVELMKMDRDHGTASERAIILKATVAPHRMLRDKVKGLAESLKARMKRAQWMA